MLSSLSKLIFCFTLHTSLNDDNDFPKKLNYCVASRFRDNADLQLKLLYISGPQIFGCWAKFAILSASTGRFTPSIGKNKTNKNKKTRVPSHTFVYRYCYLFYLLRNKFAMWLVKLILLLHKWKWKSIPNSNLSESSKIPLSCNMLRVKSVWLAIYIVSHSS